MHVPEAPWHPQGEIGCQYVTFNSSSTLLAASSDYLRLVSVFEVPTGGVGGTQGGGAPPGQKEATAVLLLLLLTCLPAADATSCASKACEAEGLQTLHQSMLAS
jgi:hypothetical protein